MTIDNLASAMGLTCFIFRFLRRPLLDLDYTQSLSALRKDIEFALPDLLESLSLIDNLTTSGNIRVYEGSNHLDIIVDGKGSLNWLIVENHPL